MEEGDVTGVDLGFMERDFDSWETQSKHFPSKIGGVLEQYDALN